MAVLITIVPDMPKARTPAALKNLESVAAGNISGSIFILLV